MEKQTISIFPNVQNQWLNGHLDFQFQNFRWKNQRRRRWFFPPPTSRLAYPRFACCCGGGAERAPSPTDSKNISQIHIYTALRYNFYTLTNTLSSHILYLSPSFLAKPTRTTQLKFPHGDATGGAPPPLGIQLQLSYNCLQYTIYLIYNYILLRIIEVSSSSALIVR